MSKGVENIGKSDVLWGYIATIFMVGSGVILLPFVLHKMPAETVGIWNIFTAITGLVTLLDFGFRPSTPLRDGLRAFAQWYSRYYGTCE